MMASRIALDSQGRLILRENGKIILPYEHFANAVMLKHMNGPHGLHLGLESTIRAVMESYTIGREYFGMEKEFIVEVVQNCPNPACRYYKNQLELSQKSLHLNVPTYIQESGGGNQVPSAAQEAAANLLRGAAFTPGTSGDFGMNLTHAQQSVNLHNPVDLTGLSTEKSPSVEGRSLPIGSGLVLRTQQINICEKSSRILQQQQHHNEITHKQNKQQQYFETSSPGDHRLADFLRTNLENLDGLSSANKDLLALHNGAWTGDDLEKRLSSNTEGQEKIVRAFAEIMKNMSRMKTYVRPAMCKPYGKQSEALQKTLVDTIQLVQSLRSFLPPPHIAVSSWKNEDKHRKSGIEELCDPVRKIE
ncbi:hypothetical protein R5R35_006878 [Gryllus longicercus]